MNERTAAEAGWHLSRYTLSARIPDTDRVVIANLFQGSLVVFGPEDLYLLSVAETLPENHPILPRFRRWGLLVDFDEREALAEMGRKDRTSADTVALTLCTTMRCNFDCPYCFEEHNGIDMSEDVRRDVTSLAERMLGFFGAKKLRVIWFGGEPLLAQDVIWDMTARFRALAARFDASYGAHIITNGSLLTQETVDRLAENGVQNAVIALDGVGSAHDRTRHFKGGAPSFARITENLRTLRIPFPVSVRHVITADNLDQIEPLAAFVRQLARESGNRLSYDLSHCGWNNATDGREDDVHYLRGEDAARVGILRDRKRFQSARGGYCGAATSLGDVTVDARGRLYKCWPELDNLEGRSFGDAKNWDPADPLGTASNPGQLTRYLDTALPNGDEKCWECTWLPFCAGGCPYIRLYKGRECLPYKDRPEEYLLALYERMKKKGMLHAWQACP